MPPSAILSIALKFKEGNISVEQCNKFLELIRSSVPNMGNNWDVTHYSTPSGIVELKKDTPCAGGKIEINFNEYEARELIEATLKVAENRAIILQKLKEALAKNNIKDIKAYASKLCGIDKEETPK